MTEARSVTATFTLNAYALSVAKDGTGSGTVTSDPAGIDCGEDCSETYDHGTEVTLTAEAVTGSAFAGWSGSGCSGMGTCVVTMDEAKSVTATFTLNAYVLSVSKDGTGSGTVTSDPTGIDCGGDCSTIYDHGTEVTLTAEAATGSTFEGWSGSGCSDTEECVVTMTEARSVTATFTLNTYALSVSKDGTGSGTVTSDPAGIDCGDDCSEVYDHGTEVTLTAEAATGSTFAGWSGAGCSGTGTCDVTMTEARSVTASFKADSSITFPSIGDHTVGDADFNPGATASSSLEVTYTAEPSNICTIVGNKVHIQKFKVNNGNAQCTVTAHQDGGGTYNPAEPVSRSFAAYTAAKITLKGVQPKKSVTWGGNVKVSVSVTALKRKPSGVVKFFVAPKGGEFTQVGTLSYVSGKRRMAKVLGPMPCGPAQGKYRVKVSFTDAAGSNRVTQGAKAKAFQLKKSGGC